MKEKERKKERKEKGNSLKGKNQKPLVILISNKAQNGLRLKSQRIKQQSTNNPLKIPRMPIVSLMMIYSQHLIPSESQNPLIPSSPYSNTNPQNRNTK